MLIMTVLEDRRTLNSLPLRDATVHALRFSILAVIAFIAGAACFDSRLLGDEHDSHIHVTVTDAHSGIPLSTRLYLTSELGVPYYFSVNDANGSAVKYEKQNWIDKQAVENHTTVSAHSCLAKVPSGRYMLVVERGKTYRPVSQTIEVNERDVDLKIALHSWSDPAAMGWYSGDTHLHRTIDELRNVVVAEDLNVALPLTNWVTFADKPPASGDKNIQDSQLSGLVQVDSTHVIWPRNTEYEIFTVGKTRHTLGALFVLGHQASLQQTVPPWKTVMQAVRNTDPEALFDMDKLDWPFAMLLPTLAPGCLYELANNHMWRTKFAFRNWNTEAPAYLQPPFGSMVGGHRQWIDYTHGMYYTLLNCGLRLPPSAGTANGVHPVPAGFGRVYVHLPQGFSYEAWMQGLKHGRSFVTTGPMLFATADRSDPGTVFKRTSDSVAPIPLVMEVLSAEPLLYGEVIINGRPEHLLRAQNLLTDTGAYRTQIDLSILPKRSGWFAVRFWESQSDGQIRFAHTAPWYVEVDGQSVAIAAHEKEYLVARMRQEITRSNGIVSPEAMQEYQQGLQFYQSLPELTDADEVQRSARRTPSAETFEHWLDNMIVDHRFTANEIRLATGLPIEQCAEEIRKRALKSPEPTQGVRIRPYPGGRHPRRGFLDGAIDPQRETKVSVFPPWADGGYVVIDVPEAIFSNLGLTYLAHTHIPTIWDKQGEPLAQLEWEESMDGLSLRRGLPNGIVIQSSVEPRQDGVDMKIQLTNGTTQPLTGLRVQVCTMLKGAVGFNLQEPLESIVEEPYVAIRGADSKRWIVTQWKPNNRVWTNPPVPCIHSDPIFPDCPVGETVSVSGNLRFYEGDDVRSLFVH